MTMQQGWDSRWHAVQHALDERIRRLEREEAGRKDDLLMTLYHLRNFANQGLRPGYDDLIWEDESQAEFPPGYTLIKTLRNLMTDINVIEQAFNQRRFTGTDGNIGEREILRRADMLAYQALKPAIDAELLPANTSVITYFQESAGIRVTPYAPVALIGIPYTSGRLMSDLLVIPHEVAHYIYWHGNYMQQNMSMLLAESIPQEPAWCYRWREELFCDIYGSFIAGPAIGLNFQELQLWDRYKDFTKDNQTHPVPILRPSIYAKTMYTYSTFAGWGDRLDARWQEKVEERGVKPIFELANGHTMMLMKAISPGPATDLNRPVDRALNEVFDLMHTTGLVAQMADVPLWRGYLEDADEVGELYPAFERSLGKLMLDGTLSPPPVSKELTHVFTGILGSNGHNHNSPDVLDEALFGWETEGPHSRDH